MFRLRRRKYRKYTTYEAQQSKNGNSASYIHQNETVNYGIPSTNANGISATNGISVTSIKSNGFVNILASRNMDETSNGIVTVNDNNAINASAVTDGNVKRNNNALSNNVVASSHRSLRTRKSCTNGNALTVDISVTNAFSGSLNTVYNGVGTTQNGSLTQESISATNRWSHTNGHTITDTVVAANGKPNGKTTTTTRSPLVKLERLRERGKEVTARCRCTEGSGVRYFVRSTLQPENRGSEP